MKNPPFLRDSQFHDLIKCNCIAIWAYFVSKDMMDILLKRTVICRAGFQIFYSFSLQLCSRCTINI